MKELKKDHLAAEVSYEDPSGCITCLRFTEHEDNADLAASLTWAGCCCTLSVVPKKPVRMQKVMVTVRHAFAGNEKIFMNGWQTWTDSRERGIRARMRDLSGVPRSLVEKYALDGSGDYRFTTYGRRPGTQHGYSYGYFRREQHWLLFGSLSEANGFTLFRSDTDAGLLTAEKELPADGRPDAGSMEMRLYFAAGTEDEVFDGWFAAMGIRPLLAPPITGYTSWYRHYQDISEEKILSDLANVKDMDVFQIDDGYEPFVGDWLTPDPAKFPHGMRVIADAVRAAGFTPGLWLAPFVCEKNSALAAEHPDWLLRNAAGEVISGGCNWSGICGLDLSRQDVRDYIREVFRVVHEEWGFTFLKLDFLYAAVLSVPADRTRGAVMCEAMDFLRDCAGDAILLGCGVPLMPAFGKVEYCRIGCDVGLDWDDKPFMRLLHRERVSTKHSLQDTIGRRQLNGRAFGNDPDVLLLREDVKLTPAQRRQIADADALFGQMLFTSDRTEEYNQESRSIYRNAKKTLYAEKRKDENRARNSGGSRA